MSDDRAYWDEHQHKVGCRVWGDEDMIETCTCGPRPAEGPDRDVLDRAALARATPEAGEGKP
jgi:hypothetical protein